MNCTACNAAGDMVPFLREAMAHKIQPWINLTRDVIRLKHQECYNYAECTCLHRLPY